MGRRRLRRKLRRAGPDDPRARFVIATAWLLYQELEPADAITEVGITALSGGQLVTYALNTARDGVQRLVTDLSTPEAMSRAAATAAAIVALAGDVVADATVQDSPP